MDEQTSQYRLYKEAFSEDLGRYLIANNDLQSGDVIFSEVPILFGPKPHHIKVEPFPCVGCCRLISERTCKKCPECSWPVCDLTCEGLKTASAHGFECDILKTRRPSIKTPFLDFYRFDILITLRALYLQKADPTKWDLLMKLQDHIENRGFQAEFKRMVQEKFAFLEENFFKPLKARAQDTGESILPEVSEGLIHKILGIIVTYSTELTGDIDAVALYPTASLLEHNCIPNTMQFIDETDGFKITLKAAMTIPKHEHITSIYTNILWGTAARRDNLFETKYFKCLCRRCQDPSELGTNFSTLKCFSGQENQLCGGWQLPLTPTFTNGAWMCNKCKIKLPEQDIMKFVRHLGDEVERTMSKSPKYRDLEDLLFKLNHFLHPHHYIMYKVKHTLVQLFPKEETEETPNVWLEKLDMCEDLIELTKSIDPGNARLGLYLAVLLNEQFVAQFKLLLCTCTKPNQNLYSDQIKKDISKTLEDNKLVLLNEQDTSTGHKLVEIVNRNVFLFETWKKENGH